MYKLSYLPGLPSSGTVAETSAFLLFSVGIMANFILQ